MLDKVEYKKMRQAYADAVIDLAKQDPRILFVSADCGLHEREFLREEGKGRMVETGIAEANSVAVAAGLASEGFKPHLLNFAYLLGRMYNQISQSVCQDAYPVKMAAYYAGVWGTGGRSHNCVTDLSIMRALPNLTILTPADYWETKTVVRQTDRVPGPTYVRLSGVPTPVVFDGEPEFLPVRVMRRGKRCTIFCHGTMVHEALLANDRGQLDAQVVNLTQIKPLPEEQILEEAQKTRHVLVVEEHSRMGGVGEAIAALVAQRSRLPLKLLAVPDLFPWSVLQESPDVYEQYGISYRHIIQAVNDLCAGDRLEEGMLQARMP
ncbi:MAG: hypothetical protein HY211_04020 [Candidatus Omnitrophica bacterium]|nr:hypothetical protein [Candidatus Omnitrophota bacterium]